MYELSARYRTRVQLRGPNALACLLLVADLVGSWDVPAVLVRHAACRVALEDRRRVERGIPSVFA